MEVERDYHGCEQLVEAQLKGGEEVIVKALEAALAA